jgi:hypothetical protein
MKFSVEDEPDLTLAEDSIHRARLEELKFREFDWTDRDGKVQSGQTLEWWWKITRTSAGDEYVGRRVKAECNPKMSNREGNRLRIWSEALLNRELPVGMSIDTDDLVGLEAEIVIGLRQDKKDPKKKWEFVSDVISVNGSFDAEPPF